MKKNMTSHWEQGALNEVAIISSDHMRAVVVAAELRKAGWHTETYLTGSAKKQFKKAMNYEVAILLDEDPIVVIDCFWGGRFTLNGPLLAAVRLAYEGVRPGENPYT